VTTIGEIIRAELPAFMERSGKKSLRILEVGVLRARDPEHKAGDGHSTLAFAQIAKETGGSFDGIDLEPREALEAVKEAGLADVCTFWTGDSIERMSWLVNTGHTFDVIYLDCDNSASATMREYLYALELLERPGLIMGDDMNTDHRETKKGKILIPYLREEGAEFRLLQRHTPWDSRDILVQEIS
jgi:predicted O-methyltransferase YrrM